jgi:hypothetical protein
MSNRNIGRQFDGAIETAEDQQRQRFARPVGERGFVGNGYWWGSYPYMTGSLMAGNVLQTTSSGTNTPGNLEPSSGASASDNSGMGGTSAGSYGDGGSY